MTLLILFESLKIHKLRHERTIQLWFVLLYVINLLPLVLPVGDKDFTGLVLALDEMLAGRLPARPAWELLSPGNWLVLGLMLLTTLITLFFSLLYATLFVGEREGMTPATAFKSSGRAFFWLVLLGLVLFLPAMLSAFLAFIPLLIFVFMMYFLPLYLSLTKKQLLPAMQASYEATKKKKIYIFFRILLLSFIVQLPQNLIQNLGLSAWPYYALTTFFVCLQAFVQGRLMGILYLFIVKNIPIVLPSNIIHK